MWNQREMCEFCCWAIVGERGADHTIYKDTNEACENFMKRSIWWMLNIAIKLMVFPTMIQSYFDYYLHHLPADEAFFLAFHLWWEFSATRHRFPENSSTCSSCGRAICPIYMNNGHKRRRDGDNFEKFPLFQVAVQLASSTPILLHHVNTIFDRILCRFLLHLGIQHFLRDLSIFECIHRRSGAMLDLYGNRNRANLQAGSTAVKPIALPIQANTRRLCAVSRWCEKVISLSITNTYSHFLVCGRVKVENSLYNWVLLLLLLTVILFRLVW